MAASLQNTQESQGALMIKTFILLLLFTSTALGGYSSREYSKLHKLNETSQHVINAKLAENRQLNAQINQYMDKKNNDTHTRGSLLKAQINDELTSLIDLTRDQISKLLLHSQYRVEQVPERELHWLFIEQLVTFQTTHQDDLSPEAHKGLTHLIDQSIRKFPEHKPQNYSEINSPQMSYESFQEIVILLENLAEFNQHLENSKRIYNDELKNLETRIKGYSTEINSCQQQIAANNQTIQFRKTDITNRNRLLEKMRKRDAVEENIMRMRGFPLN